VLVLVLVLQEVGAHEYHRMVECGAEQPMSTRWAPGGATFGQDVCTKDMNGTSVLHKSKSTGRYQCCTRP